MLRGTSPRSTSTQHKRRRKLRIFGLTRRALVKQRARTDANVQIIPRTSMEGILVGGTSAKDNNLRFRLFLSFGCNSSRRTSARLDTNCLAVEVGSFSKKDFQQTLCNRNFGDQRSSLLRYDTYLERENREKRR